MEESDQKYKNRLVLLLIAGIPLTMILGATWLWYFVVHGDLDLVGALGTANRGTLVQPPRQIDEAVLLNQNGAPIRYADLERRWTMLIPGVGEQCDAICENKLYLTRQVHLALGKGFNRLSRLYLSETRVVDTELTVQELSDQRPAPASFASLLAEEHRGLKALTLEAGTYSGLFAEYGDDPSTWYLVDPGGWVMMSYNSDVTYKEVISDLKFLLKNSSE
jgi:hypothetical protein